MDFLNSLGTDATSLAGTATYFGQGAIASTISGNPFYSLDPAAANIRTGFTATGATANSGVGTLVLLALAYFLFVK